MNKFKYNEHHESLGCECPPKDLKNVNMIAYRWVFDNLNHHNNYLPPLIISPTRIDDFEECGMKCDAFALSFFIDPNKAETKLKQLIKRKPLLIETLGNSIAKVKLVEEDGLASEPNKKTTHFNFHEFEKPEFKFTFELLKKIQIE